MGAKRGIRKEFTRQKKVALLQSGREQQFIAFPAGLQAVLPP
jgi:hypothetical protein